jgi:hypothetical protein
MAAHHQAAVRTVRPRGMGRTFLVVGMAALAGAVSAASS